jgi:hypothetical protein
MQAGLQWVGSYCCSKCGVSVINTTSVVYAPTVDTTVFSGSVKHYIVCIRYYVSLHLTSVVLGLDVVMLMGIETCAGHGYRAGRCGYGISKFSLQTSRTCCYGLQDL